MIRRTFIKLIAAAAAAPLDKLAAIPAAAAAPAAFPALETVWIGGFDRAYGESVNHISWVNLHCRSRRYRGIIHPAGSP